MPPRKTKKGYQGNRPRGKYNLHNIILVCLYRFFTLCRPKCPVYHFPFNKKVNADALQENRTQNRL
jgi:hypothetical protein